MKKSLKILCVICVAIILCITTVCAEDGFDFVWEGNYTDMTLDITINSPVKYTQTVSVAMYPDEIENPSVHNYCRMYQVNIVNNNPVTVSIPIADDLYTQSGKYTVVVQGSGADKKTSRKIDEDVYILTSSQINGNMGLLSELNKATWENVSSSLAKVEKALVLSPCEAQNASQHYKEFINIRINDFENEFKNLDDVKRAWECARVLEYIKSGNVEGAELRRNFEFCSEYFGIDVYNEEYCKLAEDIYNILIVTLGNDGMQNIKSCAQLQSHFTKAVAISNINNSEISKLEAVVKKYADVLEIKADYIKKFDEFSSDTKNTVLRQLHNKNFYDTTKIAEAFETAVDALSGNAGNEGGLQGIGSGGSAGGGSVGGFGSVDISAPAASGGVFADCGTNHWAYQYVDKLSKRNVVNGYQNGMFYPDRQVTREEFVKMIISGAGLYNSSASCDFDDVQKQQWYYGYIASAVQSGIISGISENEFGTGQDITREDAAVIASRILKRMSKYPAADAVSTTFSDSKSISNYAKESVSVLSQMNIINGFEDGSFKPKANLTRAQAAKIISLIIEQL